MPHLAMLFGIGRAVSPSHQNGNSMVPSTCVPGSIEGVEPVGDAGTLQGDRPRWVETHFGNWASNASFCSGVRKSLEAKTMYLSNVASTVKRPPVAVKFACGPMGTFECGPVGVTKLFCQHSTGVDR